MVTAAAACSLLLQPSPPLPPPQLVVALEPNGDVCQAAFSHSAVNPLADLCESIADAAQYCTGDGLELRAMTGALSPRGLGVDRSLRTRVVREAWEGGTPVFPDRMPAPGQAVVVRYVDVPDLPPERRCGRCLW